MYLSPFFLSIDCHFLSKRDHLSMLETHPDNINGAAASP